MYGQNDLALPNGRFGARPRRRVDLSFGQLLNAGRWNVVGRRRGKILFEDTIDNDVVDAGLNALLGSTLTGETQVTSWYILVTSGAPTVAVGDTMASHAGWVEYTGVSNATRLVWAGSRSATASATNPTAVQYTFNATGTVGGAGLASVVSLGGSTGTLFAVGAFTAGNKLLNSGDTIDITATFTNTNI